MKLERSLYQRSYLYFIVFFLFMLAGFWVTYFSKILDQENYRMHTHGVCLILWCLMLITQPLLIRNKQHALHRSIGKFSYVLVPLLIFTTVDLLKYRLAKTPTTPAQDMFFIALVLNALAAFLILYGLAIYHRKRPTIHARFMICTAFTMFTPITDRILDIHFPQYLGFLPTLEGHPLTPMVGFALADLLLIGLCIWDWRSHRRWNVFPSALALLVLYHYSVLTFYKFGFWASFSNWFLRQ
jgi:hypothetical protein